jgi:hypothetical protein
MAANPNTISVTIRTGKTDPLNRLERRPAKNHVKNTPKATAPAPPAVAIQLTETPIQSPNNAITPATIIVTADAKPETRARAT